MTTRHRPSLGTALLALGSVALVTAAIASPGDAAGAARQSWSPFVLVAGLLLTGVVAHRDGLFDALGGLAGRIRARPPVLLVVLLLTVAAVTAVLNLDTSVAFLTPVLVLAARRRGLDEEPFLYGSLLMSNAASLLLPGSNLTNLLVLAGEHVSGAVFAARMLPAWIGAVGVTAAFTVVVHRRHLPGHVEPPAAVDDVRTVRTVRTASVVAVMAAVVLMLASPSPALPVLAVGVASATLALWRRTLAVSEIVAAVGPTSLAGVYGIAVALGTVARAWSDLHT